jgi:uncharacterized protein
LIKNKIFRFLLLFSSAILLVTSQTEDSIAQYTEPYASFFRAILFDDEPEVRRMLLKGFNPNSLTEEGVPAISYAMVSEANKTVRTLLLSDRLDVNQQDLNGDTPIMVASLLNNSAWVASLLSKGAKLKGTGNWTALHYAAASGSTEAMTLLINAGADVNAKSPNGTTALMMAARENHPESARLLLKSGANAGDKNQSGYTAAGYAIKSKNEALAKEILDRARAQEIEASNS